MVLTIYDNTGAARADISANDSSTQQKSIQGDNVLSLSFTHYAHVALDVNWYIDYEGERYWLQERYAPKQVSDSEWSYDLKLYGIESLIKRFLVLESSAGVADPVFTLTAPAADHVALVVKSINDGMGHTTNWKVGQVDGTEMLTIDYEGKFCDAALKEIAEQAGGQAEWWIEGETVNVCRCEHGDEITLGYGNGLTSLERDTSNTDQFYTRLFPIGSSRNIDASRYGHSRLQLPGGKQYVEVHSAEYGIFDRYERDAFSDIYPRRVGTVSRVRSEEKPDGDGGTFTIYYFQDIGLTFDPNGYELAGETKRVSFQDGDLNGLGQDGDHYFEVNYNSTTREFEIITIWPYDDGRQLPGGSLIPRVGDHYILWNIRMPDEYYAQAEQEFQSAVEKYNADHWQDISVYKAPTDHVWVEERGVSLHVGRRVRLESAKYFPDSGYRQSRITKITRKVTLPSQMDIEISDALQTGALDRVSSEIGAIKSYTKSQTSSLRLPDIIRSWDTTLPTDTNLFSARRSQQEFLSKKNADRAKGLITFEQGISLGQEDNGRIDGLGNAELLTAVVRELLRSAEFRSGWTGEGWRLAMDGGLAKLEVDDLTVRRVMHVMELLIERLRSVGGQIAVSAANGKIKSVEDAGDAYKITFEQGNTYMAHDLIRCATYSGGTLQRGYWVEVSSAESGLSDGSGWVTVPKSEFAEWNAAPQAGDETALMGNTEDVLRQNLILISATEDGQPRIDVLNGVREKSLSGCLRARLGNLDGIRDGRFPQDNQPHGDGLYADNAYLRGTFLLTTGEDVKTRFEITEGKIQSAVDALRDDIVGESGFLGNASFSAGLSGWDTETDTTFWLSGGQWLWVNGSVLTHNGAGTILLRDMGRTVMRIRNSYLLQTNGNLRSKPTFRTGDDGLHEASPVYLTFFYRCSRGGTLHICFDGVDKSGFSNFNSMDVSEEITETEGYVQHTCDGLWNGTGDFRMEFTGEIYVYMLLLTTDKTDALTYRYRTLFGQSERLVKIAAAVYDRDGNALQETGLVVRPEGSGLYAQGADGKVALVGVAVEETDSDGNTRTVVRLAADNIRLEGLVTANGHFKILEDGSVEAVNAKVSGEVNATSGHIGGFAISDGSLVNDSGSLRLGSDGSARLGGLQVGSDGSVNGSNCHFSSGTFTGAIYATSGIRYNTAYVNFWNWGLSGTSAFAYIDQAGHIGEWDMVWNVFLPIDDANVGQQIVIALNAASKGIRINSGIAGRTIITPKGSRQCVYFLFGYSVLTLLFDGNNWLTTSIMGSDYTSIDP